MNINIRVDGGFRVLVFLDVLSRDVFVYGACIVWLTFLMLLFKNKFDLLFGGSFGVALQARIQKGVIGVIKSPPSFKQ